MKAVANMPSNAVHHLWDSVCTRDKMMQLSEKTESVCLAIIVIIGATPVLSTVIAQLAGRQIIAQFSQAMSNVVWMGAF
jgi:hypothetical protein